MESLINPILYITIVVNIILSLVIFSRGLRNTINLLFGFIGVFSAIWGIAIVGFYSKEVFEYKLNWIILTHSSALFISLFFLYFSVSFPKKIVKSRPFRVLWGAPALLIVYALLTTELIIGKTSNLQYEIGDGYVWYSVVLSLYFLFGYLFLFKQYNISRSGFEKRQIKAVLWGTVLSSLFAIIPDLVLPSFGIFSYTWLGPVFTLIMVFSIFIAIFKYGLFNIKIIVTESFVILIIIGLIFEIFTAQTTIDLLIKSLVLVAITIFGYLLIKSVYKEVETREKIELLAKDLEIANERLKFLDKQKSEFVSIASHQLRSPLTAIKGYTSMVLEGSFGFIEPKTREAVERIFQSAQNLVGIVDDLLNITRLEQGRMEYSFEKVDLSALTKEIVDSLYPNALGKKLGLTFENDNAQDYFVNADLLKIRQVVLNLVDNAIKYTKEGAVKVNVSRDSVKKIIKVMVTDSGVGITPELRTRLFEKFSRGDDVSKLHTNGTGLGLYIAKQMIEAHKGSIGVNSEGEGKGSTFYIELPALN